MMIILRCVEINNEYLGVTVKSYIDSITKS